MSNDGSARQYTPIPLCTDDDNDFIRIDVANNLFQKAYSNFNDLRIKCNLCDVVLVVEGKKLSAHKVVLAAAIPYFHGMFTLDMMEVNMKEITLPNMEYDTIEQLITFSYTGELTISTSNVQSLMIGANFLQLSEVVAECSKFLISRLHYSNCLSIREFCRMMGAPKDSIDKADSYIMKHFLAISRDDDFARLSLIDVVSILNFDGLYVDSEEDIFKCAMKWLQYDDKRQVHAAKILSCVRLPLLSPSFIADVVSTHHIVKKDLACRDLIDEAKDYHLIPERRSLLKSFNIRPRSCPNVPCLFVAIGGLMHPAESKSSVEVFDPLANKWNAMNEMVTLRTRVGVAVYNRQVFAIGGFNGQDRLKLVEVLDYDSNTWKTIAPLSRKRSALSAGFVGKRLYVCGGYDGIESLSSVEYYDIDRGVWEEGPSMLKHRSATGIAVLDGFIYICGGHDGVQIFNTVERFNVNENKWEMMPPMLDVRCRFGATTFNGKIYVAGGYDGNQFLRSVECFDPVTMKWSYVTPMKIKRSRLALVSNIDGIYAIAGFDGENNLCSVEVYDEANDCWKLGTPLATHEGGIGVGAIPIPPHLL